LKRERKRNKRGANGRKSTKPLHHLNGGAHGPVIDGPARGALESALRERRPQSALQGATRRSPQKLKRPSDGSFIDDWLPLREQSRRSPNQRDASRRFATGRTLFDVPAPEIGLDPIAASRGVLATRRPRSRHAAGLPKRPSDPIRFSSSGVTSTSERVHMEGAVAASHKSARERRAVVRKAEIAAAALVGAGAGATFVRMERNEKSGKWHATQSNPNLTTNWPLKVGKVAVTKVGEDDFVGLVASPRKTGARGGGGGSTASKRDSATPAGRDTKQPGTASHGKAWGAPPARAHTPAAGRRRTQNAAITMKPPPPWANKRELQAWAAHLQAVLPDQRDVLERTRSDEEEAAKLRAAERDEQRKKLRAARALTPAGTRAKNSASVQRGAIALPLHVVNSHSLAATATASRSSKPSAKPDARASASWPSAASVTPATDFTLRRGGAGEAKGDEVKGDGEDLSPATQVDDAALAEFDSEERTLRTAAETMKVELKALLAQSQAHASNPTADPSFLRKFNELSVAYRANTTRLATATQRRGTRPLSSAPEAQHPTTYDDVDAAAVEDNQDNGTAATELDEGSAAAAAVNDAQRDATACSTATTGVGAKLEVSSDGAEAQHRDVCVSTSLSEDAAAGTTVLAVVSTTGWRPGMFATLNVGAATEETIQVASIGSLSLEAPLVHAHARGETVSSVARNEASGVFGDATGEEQQRLPSRAAARRAAALVFAEGAAETTVHVSDPAMNGEAFSMRKAIAAAREERIPLPSLKELKSMPTLTGLADRVRAAAMRSGTSPRTAASVATARQSRWCANSASRTTKKAQQQRELTLKRMREREAERKSAADAEAKLIAAIEDGSAQRAARFTARPVPSAVTDIGRYERLLKRNAAKRTQEHAEHAAELMAQDSSFRGLETRRAQIEERKRKRAQRQRAKQLKRDAAARGEEDERLNRRVKLLSASSQSRISLADEMEQRNEERRIRIELRASDSMAKSKMPARMEAHAKKIAAAKAREARRGSAATRGVNELSESDRAARKARQLETERIMRRDALDAKSEKDARKAHAAAFPDAPSFLNPESTRVKNEARRSREKKQRKQDQLLLDQKQAQCVCCRSYACVHCAPRSLQVCAFPFPPLSPLLSPPHSAEIAKRQALLEKTRRAEAEARALEARNARRHPGLTRRHTTKAMEARQKALLEAQEKLAVEAAAERARLQRAHQNDVKMAVAIRHAMQEGAKSSLVSCLYVPLHFTRIFAHSTV
jgi:hypothetical protein